jgi:hypothetical protein
MVPAVGILASVFVNVAWLAWYLVVLTWALIASQAVDFGVLWWSCVVVLVTGLINYWAARGAIAMLQLKDYRAAIRGAWFAFIPCNVGCFVALPFAVYADWLLRDPRIHAAFANEKVRLIWRGRG